MIEITEITQTCDFCPSQWEGTDNEGYTIYIRYRHGYLSVRRSSTPTEDYTEAVRGEEIFGISYGHELDGVIDLETVLELAGGAIKMKCNETNPIS